MGRAEIQPHPRLLAQPGRALVRGITQRQIEHGSHRSVQELETAIRQFIAVHNQHAQPFLWTNSADQILTSIARFASGILALTQPYSYKKSMTP
jgi:hypothetical protein